MYDSFCEWIVHCKKSLSPQERGQGVGHLAGIGCGWRAFIDAKSCGYGAEGGGAFITSLAAATAFLRRSPWHVGKELA